MSDPVWHDDPFGIDARGRTRRTDEEAHIRDLIRQVLFTNPGERVNRPEFGTPLKSLVFEPIAEPLLTVTGGMIQGALIRWLEPLITVEGVEVLSEDGTITISVVFRIIETGERRRELFAAPVPV